VVTSQEAGSTGIFSNALGEDIDNIFSGLTDSTQLDVTPETLSKFKPDEQPTPSSNQTPVATTPVAPAAVASPKSTGDMPAVSQDMAKEILKTGTPSAAQVPTGETATQFKEVKEFGRLSSRSAATPKAAGESVGAMKTIGKLLLDVQAVENIIKAGETKKIGAGLSTAKIISAARGEGIKNILTSIDTYEGVSGSLIVGHDGLVISSTVGSGWDKDMLGALSTALLSTSNLATKKLEIGKLRQMVLLTNHGEGSEQTLKATLLTDVEVGILAVFVENTQIEKLDGLLETIQKAVHGG
jgi:predicted regulator of Ras-like GTPase activity (Roadblock/LC7/MglB family)